MNVLNSQPTSYWISAASITSPAFSDEVVPQDEENEDVDITFVRDALPPGTCLGLTCWTVFSLELYINFYVWIMQFDWRCQEGDQTEKRDRRRASFLLRKLKRPWSWEIVMGWKTGNALAIDTSVCFLETSSSISRFCYFHAWRDSISLSLRLSHIVSLPTSCLLHSLVNVHGYFMLFY